VRRRRTRCSPRSQAQIPRQWGHRAASPYDAALVGRDKLAKELAEVYPAIAEQLADLAGRLTASDAAIERVNQMLPELTVASFVRP